MPDLDAVITAFVREGHADTRELRGALSHVASDLGTMDVAEVRPHHVQALLDELDAAGLPPARHTAVVSALRELYAYAIGRGLVRTSPVVGLAPAENLEPAALGPRTSTDAMLQLGEQVMTWTVRLIVIAFVLIVVALGIALA